MWGIVFIGASGEEIRNAVQTFNTEWFDLVKAIVVGLIIGFILRFRSVRNYIEGIPFGTLLTGVGIGIIGLGFLGVGVFGAAIVFVRHGDIELIKVPLHASVVGLSAYCIYFSSRWRRSEEI